MKKQFFLSIATFLFFIGLSSASAQINLSLNVDKGKKYEYRMEMSMTTTTTVNGQKISGETTVTTTYDMDVLDKTKEIILVKYTYKDFAMNISSMMMKMSYDSKQTTEPTSEMDKMLANTFKGLINKSFDIKFTPEGKVISATGMNEIVKGIEQSDNDAKTKQMVAGLKQQFSDETMKHTFEQSFNIYPGKPIKVGDSWNINQSLNISGAQTGIDTKYTLKSASNNLAKIDINSDISMDLSSIGVVRNVTGTMTGNIDVDVDTGLPVIGNAIQDIKGNVEANGMNMPISILMKVKYSVKGTN
jgi:hypothetical protein